MDTRKVEAVYNATTYFEVKWCVREQPLTLTDQVFLDKSKLHERSLAYYKNPSNPHYNRDQYHTFSQDQIK